MASYLDKFIAYGKIVFKTSTAYRLEFMSSVIISPLILILYFFIWQAVFRNSAQSTILGYSFGDMITYYVLSMLMSHFIFNLVGNDLQEKITYGDLIQDLLKPLSIFQQFLSMTLADRAYAFLVEVIPVFIISVLLFRIQIPDLVYLGIFAISAVFALLINFMIGFSMGMIAFWISKIESLQWLLFFFARFLSGEFIPLDFFGSGVYAISRFLPFYYVRYGPIQIFLAKPTLWEAFVMLLIQAAWIIGFYLIIRILWRYAIKRFGAQGG